MRVEYWTLILGIAATAAPGAMASQFGYTTMGKPCSEQSQQSSQSAMAREDQLSAIRRIRNEEERNRAAFAFVSAIPYPEQGATHDDYRRYAQLVLTAGQYAYHASKAGLVYEKLALMPHAQLPTIMDALDEQRGWQPFGFHALKLLVKHENKNEVLARMTRDYRYFIVVEHMGWQQDARDAAFRALENHLDSWLPDGFLGLCISYADDAFHPLFVEHLRRAVWPNRAYRSLSKVVGVDFGDSLIHGWQRLLENQRLAEAAELVPALLDAGHKPALDFVIDGYPENYGLHSSQLNTEFLLARHLVRPADLPDAELVEWYYRHRPELLFDAEVKKFRRP